MQTLLDLFWKNEHWNSFHRKIRVEQVQFKTLPKLKYRSGPKVNEVKMTRQTFVSSRICFRDRISHMFEIIDRFCQYQIDRKGIIP